MNQDNATASVQSTQDKPSAMAWRCTISAAIGAREDHERILAKFPLGTPNRPAQMIREAARSRQQAEAHILNSLGELYALLATLDLEEK